MLKNVATDFGNVLFKVVYSSIMRHFKNTDVAHNKFLEILYLLDTNQINEFEAWRQFNSSCFKTPISFAKFHHDFTRFWYDINEDLLRFYQKLKNSGVNIIGITDVSRMSFLSITARFPEVIDLFMSADKTELQIITSFNIHSCKKEKGPFIRACSNFGIKPKETLMVDDKFEVLRVARELGFKIFMYDYNLKSADNHAFLEKYVNYLRSP